MKKKFLVFLKTNFIIWAFWTVSIIIELTGVCVTSGKFYIRNPLMFFSILGIFTAVLFSVKNQKGRYWCAFVIMTAICVVDLIFIVIYEMTGGSMFTFYMFNLRGDAMTIVQKIEINFIFVFISGIFISAYMVLARYCIPLVPAPKRILHPAAIAGIMAGVLALHGGIMYLDNYDNDPSDLTYLLYSGSEGSYADRGIFGNFVDELYKDALFSKVKLGDTDELNDFIYSSVSKPTESEFTLNAANGAKKVFGAAKDYNVVTILAESLEWFSFMAESPYGVENAYPGGFNKSFVKENKKTSEETEEILRSLYPNLYKLYDTSVIGLNHHSREKTDVSENHSIIGNYPTGTLINYEYPENSVPYSVPNVLKNLYGVSSLSFHDGNYKFYNRNVHHTNALGFEKYTAIEQMIEADTDGKIFNGQGADAWSKNEHVLDSKMIEACKNEMFPANRRFNTFITSITMHGQYDYRENLNPYYEKLLDTHIADIYFNEDYEEDSSLSPEEAKKAKLKALENDKAFIHYAAAAIDFDIAIGKILDYLENTVSEVTGEPLINNTLLVVFGDHNAYYQGLGEEVKQLKTMTPERNYTDLYRVPLMIHIGNQTQQLKIEKFTCTVDIVPTIFDLLGIKYFDNLNYGSSIFNEEKESIIYSCSYNVFITDKLFFTSINNIRYAAPGVTKSDIADAENKALTLLNKTSHINRIFYHDFLSGSKTTEYYNKLREINS